MIPASYTFRNLLRHKVASGFTIIGTGLVVFVFAGSMMLTNGLKETLVAGGSKDNVICIREASQTEVQSIITYDQARTVSTYPEVARDDDGTPLFTNEVYVLISLKKRGSDNEANIVVRGVTDKSMRIRRKINLIEGRMWENAGSEIIAGKSAAEKYKGCAIGEKVRFGARDWTVVGIFDAEGTGIDSEIWCDINQAEDAFRRPVYSSITFRLADPSLFPAVKEKIEDDRRLPLEVLNERDYYERQSNTFRVFIGITGNVISVIFSLGAIVGAMITMYAAVANRVREIGTLRALGFSRFNVLSAFLFEAILISLAGGVSGIVMASLLSFVRVSTTNWDTFSEIAFNFRTSGDIVFSALIFAGVMGLIGGFLPAVRAARMQIVNSLRG